MAPGERKPVGRGVSWRIRQHACANVSRTYERSSNVIAIDAWESIFNLRVAKILVRCEPRGIGCQALHARRVIKRDHLVHYQVQRVAFAIALLSMGQRRSCDLRDRQIVTSPHDKSAGMERAISRRIISVGISRRRNRNSDVNIIGSRTAGSVRASSLLQLMTGNLIRDRVFSQ